MNTKERTLAALEQLRSFFMAHNVAGWVQRTDRAIQAIRDGNANLKDILHHFIGAGMGSLIDLYISSDNDHVLQTSQEEANKQLSQLTQEILAIKYAHDSI